MLFQHNFVHADCHGGNIMVKINKNYSALNELKDYYDIISRYIVNKLTKLAIGTKYLKNLA
jgi:predicted unusual protein kinase regulating ubiquinone biosynthesis (AarF/ABC1/UbiB family)